MVVLDAIACRFNVSSPLFIVTQFFFFATQSVEPITDHVDDGTVFLLIGQGPPPMPVAAFFRVRALHIRLVIFVAPFLPIIIRIWLVVICPRVLCVLFACKVFVVIAPDVTHVVVVH